jgi:hypothetical protein
MRTHPVFYVGLLKPYRDPEQEGPQGLAPEVAEPQREAMCPWLGLRRRWSCLKLRCTRRVGSRVRLFLPMGGVDQRA